ncbi:MAG: bifunctional phosphoribosylaminoimidazolecarboxamide formyltransferase/IMP cyclohydrolase, partial [Cetobacterium sp.]
IAPSFEKEALDIITQKKNIRVLQIDMESEILNKMKVTSVMDGALIQEFDEMKVSKDELVCVTEKKPTDEEIEALIFTWNVVKHVKSNAIVVGKDNQTIGIGAGQMNRVGAAKIALEQGQKKCEGAVLASDAFFPMEDTVELAAKFGITAIIQPGGSIKDTLSIEACNKHGIAMVFTGVRHFKH